MSYSRKSEQAVQLPHAPGGGRRARGGFVLPPARPTQPMLSVMRHE